MPNKIETILKQVVMICTHHAVNWLSKPGESGKTICPSSYKQIENNLNIPKTPCSREKRNPTTPFTLTVRTGMHSRTQHFTLLSEFHPLFSIFQPTLNLPEYLISTLIPCTGVWHNLRIRREKRVLVLLIKCIYLFLFSAFS